MNLLLKVLLSVYLIAGLISCKDDSSSSSSGGGVVVVAEKNLRGNLLPISPPP